MKALNISDGYLNYYYWEQGEERLGWEDFGKANLLIGRLSEISNTEFYKSNFSKW